MSRYFTIKTFFFFLALALLFQIVARIQVAYEARKHQDYIASLKDTASPNVQTLKDTILIDYLGTKRTLWIYLPPNYAMDSVRYPVIYFMDGASLFSEKIKEGMEWQVDEVMDSIAAAGGPVAIVVGIDNSDDRLTEYKPFLSPHLPEETSVTGDQHAEWIASDLKDWVDRNYRTLPSPETTTIGGASLGGLMAYYALTTYPDIFGNAIVFSPSFWVNEQVFTLHHNVSDLNDHRIYLNVGEQEGGDQRVNAQKIYDLLLAGGMSKDNIRFDIEAGEGHSDPTWRKGFRKAYPWVQGRSVSDF
ncbi:alpha/beta hydrolase [Lewinella sp. LCG006]|uniref:alpha/beta hydrolase n=1 Tax=Lewinella sp. LCG006 TaxID=3231911 RepID=UPI00345FE4C3